MFVLYDYFRVLRDGFQIVFSARLTCVKAGEVQFRVPAANLFVFMQITKVLAVICIIAI